MAVRDSEPPACAAHRREGRAGFYHRNFSSPELVDLAVNSTENSLSDEIAAARVALRRVLDYLDVRGSDLTPGALAELTALTFRGVDSIARLIKAQQSLAPHPSQDLSSALIRVIEEVAQGWEADGESDR